MEQQSNKSIEIHVDNEGKIHFLYDDCVADLFDSEKIKQKIKRVSYVEPLNELDYNENKEGKISWYINFEPISGNIIYGFKTRSEALRIEKLIINEVLKGTPIHKFNNNNFKKLIGDISNDSN